MILLRPRDSQSFKVEEKEILAMAYYLLQPQKYIEEFIKTNIYYYAKTFSVIQ